MLNFSSCRLMESNHDSGASSGRRASHARATEYGPCETFDYQVETGTYQGSSTGVPDFRSTRYRITIFESVVLNKFRSRICMVPRVFNPRPRSDSRSELFTVTTSHPTNSATPQFRPAVSHSSRRVVGHAKKLGLDQPFLRYRPFLVLKSHI